MTSSERGESMSSTMWSVLKEDVMFSDGGKMRQDFEIIEKKSTDTKWKSFTVAKKKTMTVNFDLYKHTHVRDEYYFKYAFQPCSHSLSIA